jgi:hypothetical protein
MQRWGKKQRLKAKYVEESDSKHVYRYDVIAEPSKADENVGNLFTGRSIFCMLYSLHLISQAQRKHSASIAQAYHTTTGTRSGSAWSCKCIYTIADLVQLPICDLKLCLDTARFPD